MGRINDFQHRWGLGVTQLHQHISNHLDMAQLPQKRLLMFARLREDRDTLSSELMAYAVNADGVSPIPPATLGTLPLLYPRWEATRGRVERGGLENVPGRGGGGGNSEGGSTSGGGVGSGGGAPSKFSRNSPCRRFWDNGVR